MFLIKDEINTSLNHIQYSWLWPLLKMIGKIQYGELQLFKIIFFKIVRKSFIQFAAPIDRHLSL